ncbi:hypothetical protein TRIUR3_11284 [Triticum urartu]|uniref:4a-hydroxytetrahydrobiopterin dehydratase n=1 Tax=Triticum urartu TaxID=4572 RepID=M7ZNZ5_TRIUA|nr:hypothetical protein TRIUR3_11284 [Triticum urartu]
MEERTLFRGQAPGEAAPARPSASQAVGGEAAAKVGEPSQPCSFLNLSRSRIHGWAWKVKKFAKGLDFFQLVAAVAEEQGHHPDLHLVGWNNVKIDVWTHAVSALKYKSKLGFEGLPNQDWTTASVKDVLKQLGGELIEILPSASRRELEVMAWLRDPSFVGKVVTVEIPEPKLTNKPPESMDEYEAMQFELGEYGPSSPRKKNSLLYPVICHMKEVVDRGPLLAEGLPDEWLPGEGEDLTRRHIFKTVLGKIDGTDGDEGV